MDGGIGMKKRFLSRDCWVRGVLENGIPALVVVCNTSRALIAFG